MFNIISDDITIIDSNMKIEQVDSYDEWIEFYEKTSKRGNLTRLEHSLLIHANDNIHDIHNEDISRSNQNVYFAKAGNNEVLGFCSVYLYKHYKKEMLIDAVWVDVLYRRTGVASKLINYVMENNSYEIIKGVAGSPESERLFNRMQFDLQKTFVQYK